MSVFEEYPLQSSLFSHQFTTVSSVDQTARLDRLDRYAKFARIIPTLTAEGFKEILDEVSLIPIMLTNNDKVNDYCYLGRRSDGNSKTIVTRSKRC